MKIELYQKNNGLVGVQVDDHNLNHTRYLDIINIIRNYSNEINLFYPSELEAIYFRLMRNIELIHLNKKIIPQEYNQSLEVKGIPFFNGVKASFTGLYPTNLLFTGIRHIVVDEEISDVIIDNLNLLSNINSSQIYYDPLGFESLDIDFGLRKMLVKGKCIEEYSLNGELLNSYDACYISFNNLRTITSREILNTELLVYFSNNQEFNEFLNVFKNFYEGRRIKIKYLLASYKNESTVGLIFNKELDSTINMSISQLNKYQPNNITYGEIYNNIKKERIMTSLKNHQATYFNESIDNSQKIKEEINSHDSDLINSFPEIPRVLRIKNIVKSLLKHLIEIDKITSCEDILELDTLNEKYFFRINDYFYMIDENKMKFYNLKREDYYTFLKEWRG
ncbi:hypothetical protein FE324_02550 [Dolosigranulum pigrum]|jgi:hypothetical protein|uniref:hypothetical protein n=1 Tax=Dolosigranulum pigrum TaxID=29394 RepID=UPI001AD88E26|nr:hypothetical protein [Dolosigranulum pigrum]QTJ37708.1 hypothetical protein FE324_02550 [Dolosigranulum pigrum]